MTANQQSQKKKKERKEKKQDNEKALMCTISQCLWCKYFHHDRFQATNMRSRNSELGRDVCKCLSCTRLSTPQFVSGTTQDTNPDSLVSKTRVHAQNSTSRTTQNLQNTCGQSFMWRNVSNGEKLETI